MSTGSMWGRLCAQADVDAMDAHPGDERAQRRFRERRLGIVSRETLDEEHQAAVAAIERANRRERRSSFLHKITFGLFGSPQAR